MTDESDDSLAARQKISEELDNLHYPALMSSLDLEMKKMLAANKAFKEKKLAENNDAAEAKYQTTLKEFEAAKQAREAAERNMSYANAAFWSLMPDSAAFIDDEDSEDSN
eukprot:GEMP01093013.1.p1 GENE.GEMP01093013.1~~GEMP01093013.1.p1  ORF type:complete len:110 (+),score=25.07 GEMP01093013.1:159-488(+)